MVGVCKCFRRRSFIMEKKTQNRSTEHHRWYNFCVEIQQIHISLQLFSILEVHLYFGFGTGGTFSQSRQQWIREHIY